MHGKVDCTVNQMKEYGFAFEGKTVLIVTEKNNPFDNYTPQGVSSKYGHNNYNLARIK